MNIFLVIMLVAMKIIVANDIGNNNVNEILKPEIVSAVAYDNEHISCENASSDENNSKDMKTTMLMKFLILVIAHLGMTMNFLMVPS